MIGRVIPLGLGCALSLLAFDPAQDVAMSVQRGQLVLGVPSGAHLKQRSFKVVMASAPGRLTVGPLPPAAERDEAGDPIWRGVVCIPLQAEGLEGDAELRVTFQPCTEGQGGVCYLPQHRTLRVEKRELSPSSR
jgi:thiol:disulfide interchange protein DsbD